MKRPVVAEQGRLLQAGTMDHPSVLTVSFLIMNRHPLNPFILVERPYDPRPYDSRYSRDYDDRRGGRGGRYDDYRGGGRDYDRPRDYDRGERDRERDRGYGRDRHDDRRH